MAVGQLSRNPRGWLRYAHQDLAAAERFIDHPDATRRHACLLAYLAAENALGAVLVFLGSDVPILQGLATLRERIPLDWQLTAEYRDFGELSRWSPEAQDADPWLDATADDARDAVQQARTILESVVRDLEWHGFDPEETR